MNNERQKNEILVNARKKLGLSGNQLAREIGLPIMTYMNYEIMRSYPTKENQEKICDYFAMKGIHLMQCEVFPWDVGLIKNKLGKKVSSEQFVPLSYLDNILVSWEQWQVNNDVQKNEMREVLEDAISTLPEQQREVMKYRYGFYDGGEYTLQEVGDILGVSMERIRQIEKSALERLRKKEFVKTLKPLLR
ncbi:MAG: sigma-70 family RNA polymerase sigma factor [Candidatus Pacearchaeota archaeon]|jgi:RNA polymerase sigma factor (sigma-70 family)